VKQELEQKMAETILLIEDDPAVAKTIIEALGRETYAVV
jgi:DNA-binding response OmpR family regulator